MTRIQNRRFHVLRSLGKAFEVWLLEEREFKDEIPYLYEDKTQNL